MSGAAQRHPVATHGTAFKSADFCILDIISEENVVKHYKISFVTLAWLEVVEKLAIISSYINLKWGQALLTKHNENVK